MFMDAGVPLRPLSVANYFRMWETGVFAEDERLELLRGMVVEKPQPTPEHDNAIEWLSMRLVPMAIAAGLSVRVQLTTVFEAQNSVPKPDLAIVEPRLRATAAHPTGALIAIEVSVSSLRLDTTLKADLYAEAALPEYWVVDVKGRTVIRHARPQLDGYAVVERLGPDDELQSIAVPAFSPLRVADVFDGDLG